MLHRKSLKKRNYKKVLFSTVLTCLGGDEKTTLLKIVQLNQPTQIRTKRTS